MTTTTDLVAARDIQVKSTGQLVDETGTLAFRMARARDAGADEAELAARADSLVQALDRRLGRGAGALILDLATVLRATWVAQEIVMADHDDQATTCAARQAQRLNGHRSRLIRRIDQLLGEDGITVMTKTYDRTGGRE